MSAETPRRPRLGRLDRVFIEAPTYFVTTCTDRRRKLLAQPAVHEGFIKFADRGSERGAWIGRYVLMPDHLHAFVALDDEKINLSNWMKALKNSLSKTLRAQGIVGPHWQKTFFDHVLRNSESASEKWNYVYRNPVRAGLVKEAEDWPFQGEIFQLD